MTKLLAIILFILSLIALSGCFTVNDNQFINQTFRTELPGYSDIKVLKQEGDGTEEHPRVLTIQATFIVYPDPIVCEGQLLYFSGDPGDIQMRWFTLEGSGLSVLIGLARGAIDKDFEFSRGEPEQTSLLLKYWIDKGFIRLEDIKNPEIFEKVNDFIKNLNDIPSVTNTVLFDSSRVRTHNLVPDLSANEQFTTYILREDGIIDLYISDKPDYRPVMKSEDCIIPTPYATSFKGFN